MLHEMLAQQPGDSRGDDVKDGRQGSEDSGYFSRRGSKAVNTSDGKRDSVLTEEMSEIVEEVETESGKDEEADDEGARSEEVEAEEEYNRKIERTSKLFFKHQSAVPGHFNLSFPKPRSGTRFISARKTAEPILSADEAVRVSRGKG